MGLIRVAVTVLVLALVTLTLMPLQAIATRRNWPLARRLPWYWQRIACRLTGIRVTVEGEPAATPLLIAANHISWLDIPVLGSVLPVSFVAKSEVAGWPVVKTLSRLQRTVYIDRKRRSQTAAATEAIARRVRQGDVMVLFAEGTTGDGNRVLPFRSALLGAARAAAGTGTITVQPVAITYCGILGLPVSRVDRPMLAWYGDMRLEGHFVRAAGWGAIDVTVSFGEPIAFGPDDDRKKVAEQCYEAVRQMVRDVRRRSFTVTANDRRRLFPGSSKGAKGTEAALSGAAAAGPGKSLTSRVT